MAGEGGGMKGEEFSGKEAEDFGFSSLVLMFRTAGLMGLGEIPDPLTNEAKKDQNQVEQSIYFLEVLGKKTKGNLTPREEQDLAAILFELRMKYLQLSKGK
jgi:hypothetical protein